MTGGTRVAGERTPVREPLAVAGGCHLERLGPRPRSEGLACQLWRTPRDRATPQVHTSWADSCALLHTLTVGVVETIITSTDDRHARHCMRVDRRGQND